MAAKPIPQQELDQLIEQAQSLAADARMMAERINRGAVHDPNQAVRSAQFLFTASLSVAELARQLLLAPALAETEREIRAALAS